MHPPATRAKHQVGLHTTLMVDVLFILLIFFILVSQIRDSPVPVELPRIEAAGEGPTTPPASPGVTLTIDASGGLHLDGVPVADLPELRQRLAARRGSQTPPPVVLRADRAARSGVTISVVHLLSELGFRRVQFDARQTGEGAVR